VLKTERFLVVQMGMLTAPSGCAGPGKVPERRGDRQVAKVVLANTNGVMRANQPELSPGRFCLPQ